MPGDRPVPISRGEVLAELAAGVEEAAGFKTVVVNLFRPESDDYEALVIQGDEDVREVLHGTTMPRKVWMSLLEPRFERYGTYLIPEGEGRWDDEITVFEPAEDGADGSNPWRKGDALIVPIHNMRGEILGLISVDDPVSGAQPSDWQIFKLRALAAQAGIRLDEIPAD